MTGSPRLEVGLRLPLDRFELAVDLETSSRVTGVFGPSGSGKSSLLESIAGLRPRARGRIRFGDRLWLDSDKGVRVAPEARRVGFFPQESLLFPHLDVRGNLLSGARREQRKEGGERLFDDVVRTLEIAAILDRAVGTLSGGERQRVALGRALVAAPELLLLDEPLSALDLPLRRKILPFLRRVSDHFAVPTLVVSHDPLVAQTLCDELLVLGEGRLVARGAPAAVLLDPRVFPIAEREGFENVLPCVVGSVEADRALVRLGKEGTGPVVSVRVAEGIAPGARTFVGLPASDILLALGAPGRISARNVLGGTIEEIDPFGGERIARVLLGEGIPPLAVELTVAACRDLDLQPGMEVEVIFKTVSARLFG
jgi:molybdate transport system ATP-binding protein